MVEDRADDLVRLLVLRRRLRAEVDPLEHEGAQREHRLPHLRRLADVVDALRRLDDVVDEPVDPLRARVSEDRDLLARQVVFTEKPVPHGVVDVVVDVRDPVDEPHDLSLE